MSVDKISCTFLRQPVVAVHQEISLRKKDGNAGFSQLEQAYYLIGNLKTRYPALNYNSHIETSPSRQIITR